MPRDLECPECGSTVYTNRDVGELAQCRNCGADFTVPGESETPARATAPDGLPREAAASPGPTAAPARGRGHFLVGKVFGKGLSIWFNKLHVYVTLTLIVNIPLFLYQWWLVEGAPGGGNIGPGLWGFVTGLINMTLSNLATATLIYAVFQALRGRPGSIGASLRYVLARLPMLLGVTLLVSLVTAFIALIAVIPGALLSLASQTLGVLVMSLCGFVALVLVMTALWTTMAVAVVENPGIAASLRRSRELTKGYRGRILMIVILLGGLGLLINWVAQAMATVMPPTMNVLFTTGVAVAIGSIGAVVSAVGYHDLRVAAEGLDTEELAAIFD